MPAIRRIKQSTTSPAEGSSLHSPDDTSVPTIQLNSHPLSATTPETPSPHAASSPPPPAKKKRSHGKARAPGHIPRPPNAFIIFRTEYIKAQATQNSTPEVSKNLGEIWRKLSPSEKWPYVQKAIEAKRAHQVEYPDYKYKPVHRRDEFGNCIRKPRSPNRPRVKKAPGSADLLDHLSESFRWMEANPAIEYPNTSLPSDPSSVLEANPAVDYTNTALPSDDSSVSSPPRSPSPVPISHGLPPSTYYHRRPSSVPVAGPNDSFFFGTDPSYAYPYPSTGFHASYSRRPSRRPSTSIDFIGVGSHSEQYGFPNDPETYLSPNDSSAWRLGHRRSISAPDLGGEIFNTTFPSQSVPQEANRLTPINPVFSNMFDRFSWNTPQTVDSGLQNTHVDFPSMQSFSASGHRQGDITVQIPSATSSSSSNFSSATSPPVSTPSSQFTPLSQFTPSSQFMPPSQFTPSSQYSSMPNPGIHQPAPVSRFDVAAFDEQMTQIELDAAASQGVYEDPRHVVAQTCFPDARTMYNADTQFFIPTGNDTATATPQATGPTTMQPSSAPAIHHPPPANHPFVDLQRNRQGVNYTQHHPGITLEGILDINDLIVDGF